MVFPVLGPSSPRGLTFSAFTLVRSLETPIQIHLDSTFNPRGLPSATVSIPESIHGQDRRFNRAMYREGPLGHHLGISNNEVRLLSLQHFPHRDLQPSVSLPAFAFLPPLNPSGSRSNNSLSQGPISPSHFSHSPTNSQPLISSLLSPPEIPAGKSTIPARLPKPSVLLDTYGALPCSQVCYCLLVSFTSFSWI